MKWGYKKEPTTKGRYLVTMVDNYGTKMVSIADRYLMWDKKTWLWEIKAGGNNNRIIAWMKLPKPYKGD